MTRRTLPVAVATTAAAALLLSACGGGGTKASDKIAGSESSAPPSASASASPSQAAGRPTITLPADVKNVFETWATGEPVKDAILGDVTGRINATDAAIVSEDPESAAIPFYYKGEALIGAAKWIVDYKKEGRTITGTTRFFSPKVQVSNDTSAVVSYCSDETKAFDKDRKTGKVNEDPATSNSYVLYSTKVDKNSQGVWQTTQLVSKRGDKSCAP
ncbi:hypothetical protein ACODT3_15665 [Streptomyces sp. 4.24]|uniref:hypothetical protein n=1 Tax=Streptomyces tritrimontium TaxID=3406573 RepID=UPI003BB6FE18